MKNIILFVSLIISWSAKAQNKVSPIKFKSSVAKTIVNKCSAPKSLDFIGNEIYKSLNQAKPVVNVKKQVKVALIDTGIDFNNKELRSKLWTPRGKISATNFGEDLVNNSFAPHDENGHGTHIAGTILGLFPSAKVYVLNYYNPKDLGHVNLERFYKAINMAIDAKVDVINISGGGPESSMEELAVLKRAREKNILIVAAGGNERYTLSKENTYYPAQYNLENIISIKNLDTDGRKMASSNDGAEIQVGVLGRIYSYVLNNCAGKMVGTSQSTAVVSALAAMLKAQHPEWGYKQLKEKIINKAKINSFNEKVVSFDLGQY